MIQYKLFGKRHCETTNKRLTIQRRKRDVAHNNIYNNTFILYYYYRYRCDFPARTTIIAGPNYAINIIKRIYALVLI